MKEKIIIVILLALIVILTSCDKTSSEQSGNKGNNKKSDNYTGDFGYVTVNQVYDYSKLLDKVYEWGDDIKMPFKKPENAKIGWYEDSYPMWDSMYLYDITKEEMEMYVKELEKEGFVLYKKNDSYRLYKDNFRVFFSYNKFQDHYVIFCYVGNVIKDREFTVEDARKLIEDKQLLKKNKSFDEFYIFAIENETVKNQGYYEFLVEAGNSPEVLLEERLPFYLLTDGEDVLLFEQNIISQAVPSNVNIVRNGDKTELIASSAILDQTYNSYVVGYELVNDKFVKKWEYDWRLYLDISPHEEFIVSEIEDGELKFWVLRAVENYNHKKGRKDFWVVDREYDMEATLSGPTAY